MDSENKKKLQEDGRRFYQLLKHTSDPRLPFAKFGSGNLQTLCHTPAAEGVDVREQLLHFHREHYCAGLMTVCVIGREPLPTLRRWVTEKFGAIPFKGLARPQWEGHPFSGPPMQVTLKPVKEIRAIHLLFPVPHGPCEHWRAKPASYWSHLLGHEGEGSVLALAKALGYATSLEAGVSYSATAWSLFGVKLRLTVAGMRHVTELVEMVFAYLKVVKAQPPLEWIHVEQQRLAQVQGGHPDSEPAPNLHPPPPPPTPNPQNVLEPASSALSFRLVPLLPLRSLGRPSHALLSCPPSFPWPRGVRPPGLPRWDVRPTRLLFARPSRSAPLLPAPVANFRFWREPGHQRRRFFFCCTAGSKFLFQPIFVH